LSLGAFVTGIGQALLGTAPGRDVLIGGAAALASGALRGTVTVGAVDGSVLGGLEARDVRLVGDDGRPLLAVGRLTVGYRLRDVLSGHAVLGHISLDSIRVLLERRPGERFNYQEVLRLGGGGGGRPRLIAFRDARIRDLRVTIRTPGRPDSTVPRKRTLHVTAAVLPYARLSSPLPGERGTRLEFSTLDGVMSDPALTVVDADGAIEILADTIAVDLRPVRLRATETVMRGRFYALDRGPLVDLAFEARTFDSDDLTALFRWLPAGVSGAGRLDVRHASDSVLEVFGRGLDLVMADGGAARGAFGMALGPGKAWAARRVDLRTRDFDLTYLRGMLDTVPMDGRLTGRTRAHGPRTALRVDLDWIFHDRQADSAETLIRARGEIAFGVPGDIVFRNVRVDTARVALATVRAISPAVALRGDVEGTGDLDGPWRNATFTGDLAHRRPGLPVSYAAGWIRLDTRRDTVGTWGRLAFDSLQWDAVRLDYPQVPFQGGMAGALELAGYADALAVQGRLAGPLGTLDGGGTFTAVETHLAARDLDLRFTGLVLEPVARGLPNTALNGWLTGLVDTDTLRAPALDVRLLLGPSRIGGSLIDEVLVDVRVADSMLVVDSLRARARGVQLTGAGRLALAGQGPDSVVVTLRADDVSSLQAIVREVAGRDSLDADTLSGEVRGRLRLAGSLAAPVLAWSLDGARLQRNAALFRGVRADGRWRASDSALAFQVEIDSIAEGERRLLAIRLGLAGRPDAVRWLGLVAIGPYAAIRSGGTLTRGDTSLLRFDSLVLRTAEDEWRLPPGAQFTLTDETITLERMRLATTDERRAITLAGTLPRRGVGELTGSVEALAVRDVWALLQYDPRTGAGELSGTFSIAGAAEAPAIQASFSLLDVEINEYRAPLIDGTLHYDTRRLTGEFNAWRGGTQIVSIDLSLPLDLGFRRLARRRLPGPLVVRARADEVDLGLLSAVSPLIRQTEGRMSVDFGIEGTWDAPELTGWLEVGGGAATLPAIGVRHRDVHGRLVLQGDTIRVDTLSAWSGSGSIAVSGTVRLAGLTRPMLDLRIRARDFRALDVPDFLTLVTSGEVLLRGPVFAAALTGSGTIPRGVIHFADIVQKEIVNLSDTLLAMDTTAAELVRRAHLGPDFENRFLDSLRIENLELAMGNDVHLRSTEADVFLTGSVLVQKQADRYRLDGTLRTPRGTYQLYVGPTIRKQFSVTRGEVRYFGTSDLNAALDIDARHQLRGQRGENVAVYVHVGGTLLAPELRLTSDVQPPLTGEEIISYLVIGAPNVRSGQNVGRYGLEESISTLTAQVSGQLSAQLMADLGVPLDYLEIRPQFGVQGVEATEIAVGRQISDRWFVALNPRICSKQAFSVQNIGGSLEFRLSRDWGILASADPVEVCRVSAAGVGRLQLGLDVLWERRF
jgi:autotransporter translocation and assembly factor TamB